MLKAVVWTAHWGQKEDTATTLRIRSTEEGRRESGQYISRADGKGWIVCISDGHLYRTPQVRETFNDKKEKTGLSLLSTGEAYVSHSTRRCYWPRCSGKNLILTFPLCLSPAGGWRASPTPNGHFHLQGRRKGEDGMAPAVSFPITGEKRNSCATTKRCPLWFHWPEPCPTDILAIRRLEKQRFCLF